MKKKRLLDADPEARKSTWYHEVDDGFVIETKHDAQPIIDYNRYKYNLASDYGPSRWNPKEWGRHVARIPIQVVEQELMYKEKDGSWKFRDDKYTKTWLNDRKNRMWRTMPGIV